MDEAEHVVVEYHKLRPRQMLRRRRELPVAWLPLGVLEWHGFHNVLGLDGVKSDGVLCRLARRLGGIVMPPLFWGDSRHELAELAFDPAESSWYDQKMPAQSPGIRAALELHDGQLEREGGRSRASGGWSLWETLVTAMLFEIESLGFELIIPYPGHAPQRAPLIRAKEAYISQGGRSDVSILLNTVDPASEDHAAAFETAVMMALYPDLVELSEIDADVHPLGTLGEHPSQHATIEYGQRILDAFEGTAQAAISTYFASKATPVQN